MPRFLSFSPFLPRASKGENISDLISPQFEELSTRKRQELAARHRLNFVRLETVRPVPGNSADKEAVLDSTKLDYLRRHPSAYWLLEIAQGEQAVRGFVGMLELERRALPRPFQPAPEEEISDRLNQLTHLRIQTAPVALGYRCSPSAAHQLEMIATRATAHAPVLQFITPDGARHRLWSVDAKAQLEPLLARRDTVILDGAARFEAAMRYQTASAAGEKAPSPFRAYNFTAAWMIDLDRNPIEFLPRHRVLHSGTIRNREDFVEKLEDYFEIERYQLNTPGAKEAELVNLRDEMECIGRLNHCYGLYIGDRSLYLLYLRDADSYEKLAAVRHSRRWKRVDVSILHAIVFDEILKIDPTPSKVSTPLSDQHAISLVDDGFADAAFLLNGPVSDHLIDIAEASELLPPRSTLLSSRPVVGSIMASFSKTDYVGEDS